jgi:hypothetical protein
MVFLSCRRPARDLGTLAMGACALLSQTAFAQPHPAAYLEVVRIDGTSTCPDATTLAAAVSRALGRDALQTTQSDAPLRFDVTFTHDSSGYVATVREWGSHTGERTIASGNSSCTELTDALAASFTVLLDSVGRDETSEATSASAPPDAAPPTSANTSTPPTERSPARTAPASELPPKPAGPRAGEWYGWQTLLVDGGTLVSVFASGTLGLTLQSATWSEIELVGAIVGATASYILAAPIVHVLHGRVGVAVGDAAMRAGLGFLGLFAGRVIGAATCTRCPGPFGDLYARWEGSVLGLLVGSGGAVALDAAVLAYEPQTHKKRRSSDRAQWTPIAVIDPHRIAAGIGGAF